MKDVKDAMSLVDRVANLEKSMAYVMATLTIAREIVETLTLNAMVIQDSIEQLEELTGVNNE